MADSLDAEHQRLMEATARISREHEALRQAPGDRKGHAAHGAKLRQHIERLRAHMARLWSLRSDK